MGAALASSEGPLDPNLNVGTPMPVPGLLISQAKKTSLGFCQCREDRLGCDRGIEATGYFPRGAGFIVIRVSKDKGLQLSGLGPCRQPLYLALVY